MKIKKLLIPLMAVFILSASAAYAVPGPDSAPEKDRRPEKSDKVGDKSHPGKNKEYRQKWIEFEQDPLKVLQERKSKVESLLKDGRISKERANEILARIDERIKAVNDFNKLSLQQKKDKVLNEFKTTLDRGLNDGKLSKEEAASLIKDFNEKLSKWDGKGYPKFMLRVHIHVEGP